MKGFRAPSTKARDRERILLMGGPGSGKTRAMASIAKLSQQTRSSAHFYIIDTDFAWDRMLTGDEFGELENITVTPVFGYDEHMAAMTKFRKLIKPDDWLVCDMIGPFWDLVQSHYVEQAYGISKTDFYLQKKKAEKEGNPFDSMDWQITKSYYQDFLMPLLFRHQGHVMLMAGVKPVRTTGKWHDDADVIDTYGRVGVRPEGDKRIGHPVHTVLLMRDKGKDRWTMTTVTDREREKHADEPVKGFALDYLRKTAGWVMR